MAASFRILKKKEVIFKYRHEIEVFAPPTIFMDLTDHAAKIQRLTP